MATKYSEQLANKNTSVLASFPLPGLGKLELLYGRFEIDTGEPNLAVGDVIQMCEQEADTAILAGLVLFDDFQNAGTVTFDVGRTGGTVDAFLDGISANVASGKGVALFAPADATDRAALYASAADTIDLLTIDGGSGTFVDGAEIEMFVLVVKKL